MCEWGTVEVMELNGRPRDIDACLAPLVRALNAGGFPTIASCCGHGRMPPSVILNDDRFIVVLTREQWEAYIPQRWIHGREFVRWRTQPNAAPSLSFAQLCREHVAAIRANVDHETRRRVHVLPDLLTKADAFEALAGLLERAEKWRAIPAIRLEQELGEIVDSLAAGFRAGQP